MAATPTMLDLIRAGDRVTIVNRFGQQHTGRAVMRGPAGWVLNMGGKHGTPGIATRENIVAVKPAKKHGGRGLGGQFHFGNPKRKRAGTKAKKHNVKGCTDRCPYGMEPLDCGCKCHTSQRANPEAGNRPADFKKGQRVQLHPGTDDWMRGDRYGDVVKIGTKLVSVKLDVSGRTKRYHPDRLLHVNPTNPTGGPVRTKEAKAKAYSEGRHAGAGDKRLGQKSEYSWMGAELDSQASYAYWYSRGYRDGWTFGAPSRTNPKGNGARARAGRRNPTLVHQGLAGKPTFHLLDKSGRAIADLYGVNLERAKRVAQTIADATGMSVEIKEATGSSVYGAARGARSLSSARPRLSNPRVNQAELEEAAHTFRKWHEFDPADVAVVKGSRTIPATLVALGTIPEFVYESDKWNKGKRTTYVHKTKAPKPVLATGPDGKGLYVIGGNVKVTADGLVG